jgi:hypothetical protein
MSLRNRIRQNFSSVLAPDQVHDPDAKWVAHGHPQTLTEEQQEQACENIGIEAGATADQTGAEIKAAYEAEADTNAFTDAEKTKVGHISVTQAVDLDAIESRVNDLDAAVVLKGTWDASAGTFPGSGAAQAGWSYIVSVGGTVDGVVFTANDRLIAITDNASTATFAANWFKADYTDVGDVSGPASAVANNFAAFDQTTGKLIKDSGKSPADFVEDDDSRLSDARTPTAHTHPLDDIYVESVAAAATLDPSGSNNAILATAKVAGTAGNDLTAEIVIAANSTALTAEETDGALVITSGDVRRAVLVARDSNRNWENITSSSDGTKMAAVIFGGQIYTSSDSGVTWTARDSNRNWNGITSSSDGTNLAAVVFGGQIYTSSDSGVTWTARDSNRNWNGITSSSDGTKLAAVVQSGQIYTSSDSGATWTARDSTRLWNAITSSSDGTKLAATVSSGKIYTSSDSGATWTARDSDRSWRDIASSSDGSKLVAVVFGDGIFTSVNSGVTWTERDPSGSWIAITSSSDGIKLAAVSQGGSIYTSSDSGATWTARDSSQNWYGIASSADGTALAAIAYGAQIYTITLTPATAAEAIALSQTALSVTLTNAPGNDGTGTLAAVAETPLTGGADQGPVTPESLGAESLSNKSADVNADQASTTKYATVKAIYDWAIALFATLTGTQTLTNKRIPTRVTTIVSSGTPTVNSDNCDMVTITALAEDITSMSTNLTGTPGNGEMLLFRIKDDGTARAITWGASFEANGAALPTTTVISKRLTALFQWDSVTSKWGCLSTSQEA